MVWLNDLGDCFESSWRELLALTILLFDSYFLFFIAYVCYLPSFYCVLKCSVGSRFSRLNADWLSMTRQTQCKPHSYTHAHAYPLNVTQLKLPFGQRSLLSEKKTAFIYTIKWSSYSDKHRLRKEQNERKKTQVKRKKKRVNKASQSYEIDGNNSK